jgi:ferredoxin--NADP+ reductase
MSDEIDNARVRERFDVHESLAIFRVAPEEGLVPAFEPGQFTNLGLRLPPEPTLQLVKRAFSIASTPRERDHLEFYVRRVDEGEFTPALFALRPGASLWLDARVYGHFTLEDVPPASDVLMVATGTGLGPFVSMVRTYRGTARWRRCLLLESARAAVDLGYRSELERIAREDPSFAYRPTLTREPATSAWTGLRGRLQSWLEPDTFLRLSDSPLDPARWQVMLCGNPEMIESVTEQLSSHGFRRHCRREPGQIHAKRYW